MREEMMHRDEQEQAVQDAVLPENVRREEFDRAADRKSSGRKENPHSADGEDCGEVLTVDGLIGASCKRAENDASSQGGLSCGGELVNPLPEPIRAPRGKMEFDETLSGEEGHEEPGFDIEIPDDDDFDI